MAIAIHRVDIIAFIQREGMEILIAFGEAHAIGCLG
jgi:hypothetical protein